MLSTAEIEKEEVWILGGRTPLGEIVQHFKPNLILIWTAVSAALLSVDCGVVARYPKLPGFLAPLASHKAYFTHSST